MNPWPFDPAKERYVSLATFRRNGKEVRTPVWLAGTQGRYYLFSEGKAGKVKRIRANGRACIAACTYSGDIRSDWLKAEARIVNEPEVINHAYRALRDKYGWQMKMGDIFSKLFGRYPKRAIIELRVMQGA